MAGKGGPGLLDIAPPEIITKRFEIRGGAIEVRGLKNREWAILQRRFPDLQKLMELPEEERMGMNQENVGLSADGIVTAIIAAGLGFCGNSETEELINDRLTEDEQVEIFGAIMELTAEQNKPKEQKPGAKNVPLANGGRNLKASTEDLQQQSSL